MEELVTKQSTQSSACWQAMEEMARRHVQQWLQGLLEDEVTQFLGRARYRRRDEGERGYRNGYGKPRQLTTRAGTVRVRRPRVRGLQQRFDSALLALCARRTPEVTDVLPQLYLHGLALGDFELALRGLFGEGAPLSASTVARVKDRWHAEAAAWHERSLADLELVYLWVDGVYVKAGLEKDKAALLVAIGGLADGRKVLITLRSGYRESTESWKGMLRDARQRGLRCPRVVIGDGHLGIWAALREVYPDAEEQRCWNHQIVNVLDQVPKRSQEEAKGKLKKIAYAETLKEAEQRRGSFQSWARGQGLQRAAELIAQDWERMVSYYGYPRAHWRHLRTTNVIESPFAALRLRTDAAKRFMKVANATAVIWKMLLVAETKFRKLNAPELLQDVWVGAEYRDGIRIEDQERDAA